MLYLKPGETLTPDIVRSANKLVLKRVIISSGQDLLNLLDFSNLTERSVQQAIVLHDLKGNEIDATLEFGLVFPKVGRKKIEIYITILYQDIPDHNGDTEHLLAFRYWEISVLKSQSNYTYLSIVSNLKTVKKFESIGVGGSLLHIGELAKTTIARALAHSLQAKYIYSAIHDASRYGWTQAQLALLPGYTLTAYKKYEKIEQLW